MDDDTMMRSALERGARVRSRTSPNPWVGAVVVAGGTIVGTGSTRPPGGDHAEIVALREAGAAARGSTLAVTLEPRAHHGRTPPCVDAIVEAGIGRVVVGVLDPDSRVFGRGVERLRGAGIDVEVGVLGDEVRAQLCAYLHQRATGRPYVICKVAASLDGGIAAPDGSSRWITGPDARRDAHQLRAESDAIVVGAGTVRVDDPALTVRHVDGPDPRRVVLVAAPEGARVRPCLEWSGDIAALLDELGGSGVLQVLVEGGAHVIRSFHDLDLVDRYVIYLAPALFGGADKIPLLAGASASIDRLWRGTFAEVRRVGTDLRVDLIPTTRSTP